MQTIEIEGKTYNVVITDGKPELVEAKPKLKPGTYRVGDVLDQLSVGDKIRIDAEVSVVRASSNGLPIQFSPTGFSSDYGLPWVDNDTLITITGGSYAGFVTMKQAIEDGIEEGDEVLVKGIVRGIDTDCFPLLIDFGDDSEWIHENALVKVVRK